MLEYDDLGRLTGKFAQGDRAVLYRYDLTGNLLGAHYDTVGGNDAVVFGYDGLGRQTSSTTRMGGTVRTIAHSYDAQGDLDVITHPEGQQFKHHHDGLGRLWRMDWQGAGQSGWTPFHTVGFDNLGPRLVSIRGSASTAYAYDGLGRPTAINHGFAGGQGSVANSFGYNPAGQIASRATDNPAYAWAGSANFTRGYSANGLNQYGHVNGVQFGYDDRGNLTSDGQRTFIYDTENRLVGTSGVTLTYDPLGRLFQIVGPTEQRQFLYDGDRLAVEYSAVNGNVMRRYAWGEGADVPVFVDTSEYAPGQAAAYGAFNTCANLRFLYADERGSIIASADCNGNRMSVNTYDEFGIPGTQASPNWGRFQYTGQAWLPDLGLYHYKARMYSPQHGRFMQTDPIGYADGLNWYDYVGGDPVNGTDPSGTIKRMPTIEGEPDPPGPPFSGIQRNRSFDGLGVSLGPILSFPSGRLEVIAARNLYITELASTIRSTAVALAQKSNDAVDLATLRTAQIQQLRDIAKDKAVLKTMVDAFAATKWDSRERGFFIYSNTDSNYIAGNVVTGDHKSIPTLAASYRPVNAYKGWFNIARAVYHTHPGEFIGVNRASRADRDFGRYFDVFHIIESKRGITVGR